MFSSSSWELFTGCVLPARYSRAGSSVQRSSMGMFPLPSVGAGAGTGYWKVRLSSSEVDDKAFNEAELSLGPEDKPGNFTASLFWGRRSLPVASVLSCMSLTVNKFGSCKISNCEAGCNSAGHFVPLVPTNNREEFLSPFLLLLIKP